MSVALHATQPAFSLINPVGLYDPAPNGYSHVASLKPGARLAFIAGQGGENENGELPETFEAQVHQAFGNLLVALKAAGAGPHDVAKLTVLIVDHSEARLHVWAKRLSAALALARSQPAR